MRFACSSESTNNLLVSIKEPTTCHYTLVFYTPILCAHHQFKQQEHPVRYIKCHAEAERAAQDVSAEAERAAQDVSAVTEAAEAEECAASEP